MNDGLPFLDIIFFAMVAVFLVLRLRSVLGKRTGHEKPLGRPAERNPGDMPDNVIDLGRGRKPPTEAEPLPAGPLGEGVAAIRAADPAFVLKDFLSGARMAFEMIVESYAGGDKKALRPLLADDVFRHFSAAIDARQQAGETLVTELIGITKVEALDARLDNTFAEITVRFVSEQVNLVKDQEGRILDGDPGHVAEVVDEWTFRRDTALSDPNWQLVATRSPQDAG